MTTDHPGLTFKDGHLSCGLDRLPDALLLCTPGGRVITANQAASTLFGDAFPAPTHAQQLIHELDEWGPEGLLTMARAGELDATFDYPTEPTPDHPTLTLSIRAGSVRNQENETLVLLSLRDISDERRVQVRLRELSMTDELTGIPNRRFLGSTLAFEEERARRFSRMLFVMFLDIDKFKRINDDFGHPEGDRAIQHFSRVLRETIRKIDTVCRWGGDEFVVVGLCTTPEGGETLLRRLLKALDGNPFVVKEQVIPVRASIGMVLTRYGPEAAMYGNALVAQADALMLEVKKRDGIQYLIGDFDPSVEPAPL